MQYFFLIPYSIIIIVLFVLIIFGVATASAINYFILKWQYIVLVVIFIAQLLSTIGAAVIAHLQIAFRIIYCVISAALDLVKQIVSMVLIMVFMLEIDNNFKTQWGFIFVAVIYFGLLFMIIGVSFFVCNLIPKISLWLDDDSTYTLHQEKTSATSRYVILLILNIILTAIYVPICMWLIKADPSEYSQLFGKSIINNIIQVLQNIIDFISHVL